MNEILSQEVLNEIKQETERMKQLRSELITRIENFLEEWKSATNYEFDIVEYDDVELVRLTSCSYYIIARNRNMIYLRKFNYVNYEYEHVELKKLSFEMTLKIAQSITDAVYKHVGFLKSKNQEYEELLKVYEKFQKKVEVNNEEVKA